MCVFLFIFEVYHIYNESRGALNRKESDMKNIIKESMLHRLDNDYDKVKQIKEWRDNGELTLDEVIDLLIKCDIDKRRYFNFN